MRALACMAMLMISIGVFAQREGDKKDIDGQIFELKMGIWVHQALDNNFDPNEDYTAVYRDSKWQKWYREGSSTLKKVLDLGPNVVFSFSDGSGNRHVWWVLESKEKVKQLLTGGAAAMLPGIAGSGSGAAAGGAAAGSGSGTVLGMNTGLAIGIGAAVVAGAVIIAENDDDDDPDTVVRR